MSERMLPRGNEHHMDGIKGSGAGSPNAKAGEQDAVKQYLREIGRTPLLSAEEEVELAIRIETGQYAEYLLENPGENTTDIESEELEWFSGDGRAAKNHMLEANLRLVVSLAKRYNHQDNMGLLDLIQEGNLGLIRGIEKFDYTKGYKVSTYVTWWIRQAISRAISQSERVVRLPVHVTDALSKIARITRELQADLGRHPTNDEIARQAGMPLKKVQELLNHNRPTTSLNMNVDEDGTTELEDLLPGVSPNPHYEVARITFNEQMWALVKTLTEREQQVLTLRYGFEDGGRPTYAEVSKKLGVSRERARQIEQKALKKLGERPESASLKELSEELSA